MTVIIIAVCIVKHIGLARKINLRFRLWIDVDQMSYLGIGRIVLLEKIMKYGSITKGAKAINMSYRKAWQLVEDMNQVAEKPLVDKRLGGDKGGGATVTEEGKKVIKQFHKLHGEVDDFLQRKLKDICI